MGTRKRKQREPPSIKFLKYVNYGIMSLENNKLFAGLLILVVNLGTKYVALDFSKTQEEYFRNIFSRQLLIFAMVWTATRDLVISILLTAAFVILSDFIVNPESNFCILPRKYYHMHKMEKEGKLTNNEIVTTDEVKKAKDVIKKANQQEAVLEQFQ